MSSPVAQTYVWHEGKAFMVSTIDRESSSMMGGTYAETMVWEWDAGKRERGSLIGQDETLTGSIFKHQRIVERLHATGRFEEPKE